MTPQPAHTRIYGVIITSNSQLSTDTIIYKCLTAADAQACHGYS